MTLSRKAAAALAAVAVGVVPTTSALAATHAAKPSKAAVTWCKTQDKKLGKTKFDKTYGGKKHAMAKCEAAYAKAHKTTKTTKKK